MKLKSLSARLSACATALSLLLAAGSATHAAAGTLETVKTRGTLFPCRSHARALRPETRLCAQGHMSPGSEDDLTFAPWRGNQLGEAKRG
ncbi:MAG: hypothetical protein J0H21_07285, partial [Rhizobiales bacterium]|nr:hypothetical protein [Hyphomicrobiales bacterium]